MKKVNTLVVLSLLTIVAIASNSWYPTTGTVVFHIKNAGITVDGKFSGIAASIKFDEDNLVNSSIFASVKAATINTGISKRDEHLKKADYLDVATYPKIEMSSTTLAKTSTGYIGQFDVTIKGITKNVSVPFTFENQGKTGTFKGSLKLNRLDFSVGESSFILGDEVNITLMLRVKK